MKISIKVADLCCTNCAESIQLLCKAIPSVEHVQYVEDLNCVVVTGTTELRTDWLRLAIEEAGYHVEDPKDFNQTDEGEFV